MKTASRSDKEMLQRFGERMKQAISVKGISQKELSRRSGITEAAISGYINGTREPGLVAVIRIAKALSVSPALFFCRRADLFHLGSPCWYGEEEENEKTVQEE